VVFNYLIGQSFRHLDRLRHFCPVKPPEDASFSWTKFSSDKSIYPSPPRFHKKPIFKKKIT